MEGNKSAIKQSGQSLARNVKAFVPVDGGAGAGCVQR